MVQLSLRVYTALPALTEVFRMGPSGISPITKEFAWNPNGLAWS